MYFRHVLGHITYYTCAKEVPLTFWSLSSLARTRVQTLYKPAGDSSGLLLHDWADFLKHVTFISSTPLQPEPERADVSVRVRLFRRQRQLGPKRVFTLKDRTCVMGVRSPPNGCIIAVSSRRN